MFIFLAIAKFISILYSCSCSFRSWARQSHPRDRIFSFWGRKQRDRTLSTRKLWVYCSTVPLLLYANGTKCLITPIWLISSSVRKWLVVLSYLMKLEVDSEIAILRLWVGNVSWLSQHNFTRNAKKPLSRSSSKPVLAQEGSEDTMLGWFSSRYHDTSVVKLFKITVVGSIY